MDRYTYLKSEEHFMRVINKIVKEAKISLSKNELLPRNFYVENIYITGLGERFTWDMRENPHLVKEKFCLEWLSKQRTEFRFLMPEIPEKI